MAQVDRCVICGNVIPEGYGFVCYRCEKRIMEDELLLDRNGDRSLETDDDVISSFQVRLV